MNFDVMNSLPIMIMLVWVVCVLILAFFATIGIAISKTENQIKEISEFLGGTAFALTVVAFVAFWYIDKHTPLIQEKVPQHQESTDESR